jgi:uncharacterized protein YcfL
MRDVLLTATAIVYCVVECVSSSQLTYRGTSVLFHDAAELTVSISQSGIPAAGADSITEADTQPMSAQLKSHVALRCC